MFYGSKNASGTFERPAHIFFLSSSNTLKLKISSYLTERKVLSIEGQFIDIIQSYS